MAAAREYDEPTGWTGWIVFASVMMIIGGGLQAFYGLVALLNDTWVGWNPTTSNAVLVDLTAWGWAHLIIGTILVLSGIGVLTGNLLARTVGVVVAGIALAANFFTIPVYPLWSISVMVIAVLVIWALTAHGREMRSL
jgi:hypothetical protein